jgi:hypothetical protein
MGRNILIIFTAVIFFIGSLSAQVSSVTVKLVSPVGTATTQIEANASAFLTELNRAAASHQKPSFAAPFISESVRQNLNPVLDSYELFAIDTEVKANTYKREKDGLIVLQSILVNKRTVDTAFTEELNLIFKPDGTLDDVTFSIGAQQYAKVFSAGNVLDATDLRRKQLILDFVERFRTAYEKKDLTYLDLVFSEKALIIVGKVVQPKPTDGIKIADAVKVERQVYSKKEYMENLKAKVFTKKWIKLGFDKVEIIRHPDPSLSMFYGVQLIQKWATPGYSDEGYLFLLIDFTTEDKPIIHVRAWEPMQVKKKDRTTLSDFEFY